VKPKAHTDERTIAANCLTKKDGLPPINPSAPGLKAVVANTPRSAIPTAPPTPCTPQTSSASSHLSRFLSATAKWHTAPAAIPITTAAIGET
jgi:hypothetical protein